MADRIDMSLDDIIKSNKKSGAAFPGKNKNVGRGGNRGNLRGGGQQIKGRSRSRSRGRGPLQQHNGGAINKNKSRSRSRQRQGMRRVVSAGSIRRSRSRSSVRRQIQGGGLMTQGGPGKLMISNLDIGVSDADIQELFAEFGVLKSATLHYDRNGRSLGTADVVFERRSDSVKAMKQYDGVPLDGKPMKIEIAAPQIVVAGVGVGMASIRPRARSASMSRKRSRSLGRFRGGRVVKRGIVRGYKGMTASKSNLRGVRNDRKFKKGPFSITRGKKKTLPVSRETLDKEIDSFMNAR